MDATSEDVDCRVTFISNNAYLNAEIKAQQLKRLVDAQVITHAEVLAFLVTHHHDIASVFLSLDDSCITSFKRKVDAVSGSDWDHSHLEYFNVLFEDAEAANICGLLPLSEKAQNFLTANNDLEASSFTGKYGVRLAKAAKTAFQRKVLFVDVNSDKESCVDVMMQSLLEEILSDRFTMEQRYKTRLIINNQSREATADVIAILFPQIILGVIVVEDKTFDNSDDAHKQTKAEAQLVARGIAVAQQENYPPDCPVYMLRALGTFVTAYKAVFTSEFVNSVKRGLRRMHGPPQIIGRHAPPMAFGRRRPGYDIMDPNHRQRLVTMICSMSKDLENAFPDL